MADAFYDRPAGFKKESDATSSASENIMFDSSEFLKRNIEDAQRTAAAHKQHMDENKLNIDEVCKKLIRHGRKKEDDGKRAQREDPSFVPKVIDHTAVINQCKQFVGNTFYSARDFGDQINALLEVNLNSEGLDKLNDYRVKFFEHRDQYHKQREFIQSITSPATTAAAPPSHMPIQQQSYPAIGQQAYQSSSGLSGAGPAHPHVEHAAPVQQHPSAYSVGGASPMPSLGGAAMLTTVPTSALAYGGAGQGRDGLGGAPGGYGMAAAGPAASAEQHHHRGLKREAPGESSHADLASKRARDMGPLRFPGQHRSAESDDDANFPPLPERLKGVDAPMLLDPMLVHKLLHRIGHACLSALPPKPEEEPAAPRQTRSRAEKQPALQQEPPQPEVKVPRCFAGNGVHETVSEGVQLWLQGILGKVSEILRFRRNDKWSVDADMRNHPAEQLASVERWSARVVEHEREEKVERLKRLARSKAGDEAAKKALELHKKAEADQKERENMSNAIAAFTAPKKRKVDAGKFTLPPSAAKTAVPTWNKGGSVIIYVKKEPGVDIPTAPSGAAGDSAAPAAKSYITMPDLEYFLGNDVQFSKSEALYQTLAHK